MKEGAQAKAKELGVTLQAYAGKFDGDNDGQVAAIEALMAAGAKGILLVPSDSTAIVPTVKKARKAGILVITLDTPLDPPTAADANIGTDNFKAGELIGQWAKATLGAKAATAKIATLDGDVNKADRSTISATTASSPGSASRSRIRSTSRKRQPADRRLRRDAGRRTKAAARRWRTSCRRPPRSTSSTRSTNRPRTAAIAALKAAGKDKGVLVVAVDGGCPGVKSVKAGIIGATSQQYPLLMAR